MSSTLRIALRNTLRQKKRAFLLGGAIAFGIMVITLTNAFTAGMATNVKSNLCYLFGGHVFVQGSELTDTGRIVNRIGDDPVVQRALADVEEEIQQATRRSEAVATLIFGSREQMQMLEGIDWEAEDDLSSSLLIAQGSLADLTDPEALILPQRTAEKLGVKPGEVVVARLTTVTGQQNVGEFRVIATTQDPIGLGVSEAYTHRSYLNQLIGLAPDQYQSLNLFLHDMTRTNRVAQTIYHYLAAEATVERRREWEAAAERTGSADEEDADSLGQQQTEGLRRLFGGSLSDEDIQPWEGTKFSVTTINDVLKPVMSLLSALNTVGLVVFIILLVITMVGIMNTFRMVLIERIQEIGTMRAIGMQRHMVRRIFLAEAAFIGLGGALTGLVAAGVLMLALSQYTFPSSSPFRFFLDGGHLTFVVLPGSLVINLAILQAMTLLAAFFPAQAAARLRPADALRTQH